MIPSNYCSTRAIIPYCMYIVCMSCTCVLPTTTTSTVVGTYSTGTKGAYLYPLWKAKWSISGTVFVLPIENFVHRYSSAVRPAHIWHFPHDDWWCCTATSLSEDVKSTVQFCIMGKQVHLWAVGSVNQKAHGGWTEDMTEPGCMCENFPEHTSFWVPQVLHQKKKVVVHVWNIHIRPIRLALLMSPP